MLSLASLSADGNLILEMQGGTESTGGILFRTGRTTQDNRMFIDNDGDVGIGTTDPAGKLHIQQLNAGFVFDSSSNSGGYTTTFFMDDTGLEIGHDSATRDIQFQTDSITRLRITGGGDVFITGGVFSPSDARLKTNVMQLPNVLEKLEKIRGVSFNWNEGLGRPTERRQIGVIAQEVEAVFPELVTTQSDEDYRAVNYAGLSSVLIEAVKQLKAEKDELAARVAAMEKQQQQMTDLTARLVRLEKLEAERNTFAAVLE